MQYQEEKTILVPFDDDYILVNSILTLKYVEEYCSTDRGEQDLSYTQIVSVDFADNEYYSLEELETIKNYFEDLRETDYDNL